MTPRISLKALALTVLGSAILAFGLYNVHSLSAVTEGGILIDDDGLALNIVADSNFNHDFSSFISLLFFTLTGHCFGNE